MAPERSFSQNQTWQGVQYQFLLGSGTYYADPMRFDFQKLVDIPQQIQTSALSKNGYFNNLLKSMDIGATSSFQFLNKSIGGNYIESIQTKQWPFGRVATDTYGSITKNVDQTYFATGIISFKNDTYSWKSDFDGSLLSNTAIRVGGAIFGSVPSKSYQNISDLGEMPVSYPRKMWFSSTGNWR